jgi:maleylpyruvate isomerase
MSSDTDPVDALVAARRALQARQGIGARNDAACAPARELSWARLGAAYFARKLAELPDAALWGASERPGWTRRRVIAACALQARALAQSITLAIGSPLDEVAETDEQALDLAETLPAHALRYLVTHAEIHLNVVWRDLSDAQWSLSLDGASGANAIDQTPALRARLLWASAVNLGNGGRLEDAPAEFRLSAE